MKLKTGSHHYKTTRTSAVDHFSPVRGPSTTTREEAILGLAPNDESDGSRRTRQRAQLRARVDVVEGERLRRRVDVERRARERTVARGAAQGRREVGGWSRRDLDSVRDPQRSAASQTGENLRVHRRAERTRARPRPVAVELGSPPDVVAKVTSTRSIAGSSENAVVSAPPSPDLLRKAATADTGTGAPPSERAGQLERH